MAIKFPKVNLKTTTDALRDVFSLRNLTVSLVSALLVIGLSYLSGTVGGILQVKAYANPIIYSVFLIVTIVLYVLVIAGPAFLAAVYTKDWPSFIYIILLEMIWLAIFIAVLFFTTPEKTPSLEDMMISK